MKAANFSLIAMLFVACEKSPRGIDTVLPVRTDLVKLEVSNVVGLANIEPRDRIVQLTSETGGIVQEIKCAIDDTLKKGRVVLLLDGKVERAQVDQAESKLKTQEAAILSQQANLEAVKINSEDARNKFERMERLFQGGAATKQALDDSRFTHKSLVFLHEVEANKLAEQNARLRELKSDLAYYQTLLDRKSIKAPVEGTVLSLDVKTGSFIDNKITIGDFAPVGPIIAITEIDELFASRVHMGQAAYIRLQGDTLQLAQGKVILIAPYLKKKSLFSDNANNLEDRRVREVRVQLSAGSKVLIGSRVECVIKTN
jgi:HlyD family secretion protein